MQGCGAAATIVHSKGRLGLSNSFQLSGLLAVMRTARGALRTWPVKHQTAWRSITTFKEHYYL